MKRKKMEKEVVHLLEWIIEYPGVWQIVCNPDGKETRASSNRNRSDRAENQRSASRSTRSERTAEMDDRDYDREREGGRYRSNTRTDASDDRQRSNSGGTRSRGTSARSRERSQDIDDRYMETDDEKLDFD